MRLAIITAAIVAFSLAVSTAPAGTAQPFALRVVTMDGRTGPAFYSVIDRRYLFAGQQNGGLIRVAGVSAEMQ